MELKSVSLSLGGPPVLDGIDLRVERGERVCLLGRNGEGKTTLLRLLAGDVQPDGGELLRSPRLRIGVLPQEIPANLDGTVREIVAAHLTALPEAAGGEEWRVDHLVDQILTRSGLEGDAPFVSLSAGNKRRALLARALAGEPDLLLLDEPTNHLDIDAITWLEDQLARFAGTLFFVTHDRAFLRGLAGRIVELDRGRVRDWSCDYDTFVRRRDDVLRNEQAAWAEFDRKLAQEEVWIRQGVRERRTRNEGRVRELKRMREERRARRVQTGDANIRLQDVERSGRLVIRTEGLGFAWGDMPMVDGLDTMIVRGDKVGILGPNGSGKTTLLRLLLGELEPREGTVRLGSNLQIAYFDQQRHQLDETKTVQENVCENGDTIFFDGRRVHVITYLQNFLFAPDRARSPITHLSGGERNRLLLARLFTRPANLLVLDEPTNDLDLETLDLLEELLLDFAGTLLLVSHDREFLDNVTTSTLALEGGGRVTETVGGYSDWARVSRAARDRAAAAQPKPRKGKSRPAPSERPRRLSFKEKQELAALPARIEALEEEQAGLHTELADPDLYREQAARVSELRARLSAVVAELPVLYARWEELEDLGDR
jgi:ATP-binding cassette subfamily F protein uup